MCLYSILTLIRNTYFLRDIDDHALEGEKNRKTGAPRGASFMELYNGDISYKDKI